MFFPRISAERVYLMVAAMVYMLDRKVLGRTSRRCLIISADGTVDTLGVS